MSEKITVPTLGESVTEATVSKWLKSQGDKVTADEPIVELETDKVNVEVPAPSNGVLGSIAAQEGQTVNVGSILGTINNQSSLRGMLCPGLAGHGLAPTSKKNVVPAADGYSQRPTPWLWRGRKRN